MSSKARVDVRVERSDGDWTEGEDRTTRGSLAVPSGKRWRGRGIGPGGAVRRQPGGVRAQEPP